MNTTFRAATAAAALTLSVSPIVLAGPALADGSGSSKAAIEYAERQAAGDGPTKAQIEQRERTQLGSGGSTRQGPAPAPAPGGGGGAAAWQLALSAALGAGMAGGVLVAARQVVHHRRPVASAH